MRPRAMFMLLGWMTATLVTGLLAWTAVQVAGSQSAPQPVRPLTAAEVEALPAAAGPSQATETALGEPPATAGAAVPDSAAAATSQSSAALSSHTGEPKVIHTTGGSVGVSVVGDQVTLAWATPSSGFQVEVGDAGPTRVFVEFESATYESSVLVTATGGAATPQITEGPKDQTSSPTSPESSEPGDDSNDGDGSDRDD